VLHDTTQLALERAISGASMRHSALASNLANANTPGYQRVDVDFHGALSAAMGDRGRLERTGFQPSTDLSAGVVRADGSTVDVDAESARLAANALEHSAAVTVAGTRIHILQIAMGVK
jgi:flagellar basal-body rod protein FlgB